MASREDAVELLIKKKENRGGNERNGV